MVHQASIKGFGVAINNKKMEVNRYEKAINSIRCSNGSPCSLSG